MANSFLNKLTAKWQEKKLVCIGLDQSDFELNRSIVYTTHDLVCAYKPNSAFYEAEGIAGLEVLKKTIDYIREKDSTIPIIFDAKRGDIGNTNKAYAKAIFDDLGADAVTVHPYLGQDSLQPFLERADKGIFVLVKTSNPGAGEFQDQIIGQKPLYQIVAEHIKSWNSNNNLAVVVGATYPNDLKIVREVIGDMPILVPGIGAQGGDLEKTLENGLDSKKQGLIISCSRGIISTPDPRETTLKLTRQIQLITSNP